MIPKCLNCGACCKCFGIYEVTKADAKKLPKSAYRKSHLYPKGYVMRTSGFTCNWYMFDKCYGYNNRPSVCRRFKRGSIECKMVINMEEAILTS
jgi:Fe-S-cluster containining protein